MSRHRVLARLLALAAFFALATGSTTALADLVAPEPAPEPAPAPEEAKPAPAPEEVKPDDTKPEEAKQSGNCSLVDNDNRVIGLAGLVLLISGFALRRRRS